MQENTLLTIFVALAALAMLIQACTLIALAVVAKRTQTLTAEMMPKVNALITQVNATVPQAQKAVEITKSTLEDVKRHLNDIGIKTNAILDVTKQQVGKVDELLTDATGRARVQMDRAEMVLDETMGRAQYTVATVQKGVIAPIREVHGILAGVRAAIFSLGRGGRPTVDHVTADEEMFI